MFLVRKNIDGRGDHDWLDDLEVLGEGPQGLKRRGVGRDSWGKEEGYCSKYEYILIRRESGTWG